MEKDEELGEILLKGFFETMKIYKEIPHTIFFLNNYNLESELKVGFRALQTTSWKG